MRLVRSAKGIPSLASAARAPAIVAFLFASVNAGAARPTWNREREVPKVEDKKVAPLIPPVRQRTSEKRHGNALKVTPGRPLKIDVEGPTNMSVSARRDAEPHPYGPSKVEYFLDGKLISTSTQTEVDLRRAGFTGLLTGPQLTQVAIPPGAHQLEIRAVGARPILIEFIQPLKEEVPPVVAGAATLAPLAAAPIGGPFAPPAPERRVETARAVTLPASQRLRLTTLAEVVNSRETSTPSTTGAGVGAEFAYTLASFGERVNLAGKARVGFASQAYRSMSYPSQRNLVTTSELRYDLTLGGEVSLLSPASRIRILPSLGARSVFFRNEVFPADLVGPRVGLRLGADLATAVRLQLDGALCYNLVSAKAAAASLSSAGGPLFLAEYGVGFDFPIGDFTTLGLGYRGEVLGLVADYRVGHGFATRLSFYF
jgi:hypothetical protein